jgi:hypothetical protein
VRADDQKPGASFEIQHRALLTCPGIVPRPETPKIPAASVHG